MNALNVVVAVDHEESSEFVAWLGEQGHQASVGNTTATTINGEINDAAISELWLSYCAA